MKKIYKKIQKYFGRLSDLNDRHSSHARLIAFFLGIIVMGSVIWYTYQYFSTASRADNPVVTYVLKTDNCTTKKASSTCKIVGDVGDLIKVHMYLESTGTNKLSGADLIFKYNIGKEGQLSFVSQSSSTFNTTLVAETHDVGLLHLARVNNKNDANLNGAETFTLTFKIEKEGASRVALITSASTIVGPQTTEDGVYTLSPQNEIGPKSNIPADAWKNIYNIAVATNGDNDGDDNPRPTLTPGQTTPGSGTTLTPIQITSAPLPVNLKDVDINFRLRFQGIVTQPKNSSPIIVKVKLVTGKVARKEYAEITFTPQGDGTYVANHTFKAVNIAAQHSFFIKGPKHIQKRICKLNPSEDVGGTYHCKDSSISLVEGSNTLDFTGVVLLTGDLPTQNGIVDSQDITYIRSNVGSTTSDVLARADLNYDGIVDTQDYTLIIKALAFKYDD